MSKLYTPEFRVSFPYLFEKNDNDKFAVQMIFDKKNLKKPEQAELMKEIEDAIDEAVKEKWGKAPAKLKMPFRDGSEKEDFDGYGDDVMFISCTSKDQPGVVDEARKPISEASGIYAGCYAHATVNVYAWDYKGKKGVSIGLGNIQKLRDGESFSGRTNPEDDFAAIGGSDSDSSGLFDD